MAPLIDQSCAPGFADAYPELLENHAFVQQVADSEEEGFSSTERTVSCSSRRRRAGRSKGAVRGKTRSCWANTFGFTGPTRAGGRSRPGHRYRRTGSRSSCDGKRRRARDTRKKVPSDSDDRGGAAQLEFVRYPQPGRRSRGGASCLLDSDDNRGWTCRGGGARGPVFLRTAPFYAEAGGRVGDRGRGPAGTDNVVTDTQWGAQAIVHVGVVESGEMRPSAETPSAGNKYPASRGHRAELTPFHARGALDR